jgi:hypothetical protein
MYQMMKAAAEGAAATGAEVEIKRVPELLSDDVIAAMGATEAQKSMPALPLFCNSFRYTGLFPCILRFRVLSYSRTIALQYR